MESATSQTTTGAGHGEIANAVPGANDSKPADPPGTKKPTRYVILEAMDGAETWQRHRFSTDGEPGDGTLPAHGNEAARRRAFDILIAQRIAEHGLTNATVGDLVAVPAGSWQPEGFDLDLRAKTRAG